jgi:hypothetical protein
VCGEAGGGGGHPPRNRFPPPLKSHIPPLSGNVSMADQNLTFCGVLGSKL